MQKRVFLSNRGNISRMLNGNNPIYSTAEIDVVSYNHERKLEKSKQRLEGLLETHELPKTLTKLQCYRILDKLRTDELIEFIHNHQSYLINSKEMFKFFKRHLSLLE